MCESDGYSTLFGALDFLNQERSPATKGQGMFPQTTGVGRGLVRDDANHGRCWTADGPVVLLSDVISVSYLPEALASNQRELTRNRGQCNKGFPVEG
jgi:hypothetical protein